MLQNRVDPFGNIIKTEARGNLMGNRGLLHNERQELRRPFKLYAWIACRLEFKGRRRKVMSPNLYTELFFLDEATTFAAGHRPCFECRRADYDNFKTCWLKGNPVYDFNMKTPVRAIDAIIHNERITTDKVKITFKENIKNLPSGTFITIDSSAYLVANGLIYRWSPFGYNGGEMIMDDKVVQVLTPRSVINAFRAGYLPQMNI